MSSSRVLIIAVIAAGVALLSFDARPALGATFTVDHTGDGGDNNIGNGICAVSAQGQCTLRAAIQEANASGAADTIAFNIPSGTTNCSGTACTITPSPQLPVITSPVTIDGYTQPGATPNTNPVTLGSNAVLKIGLAGPSMGSTTGLIISAGNSTVRGLAINGFREDGIVLSGAGGNTVAGNHIGTGPINDGSGVFVSGTSNNTIGGETPADRNVISGSQFSMGIAITGAGATDNVVWGNFIGTQADGVSAGANALDGVNISSSASNNEIGDVVSGRANVIAFNGGDGVNIPSTGGTGNAIRGNIIHSNTGLGIDLGLDGITPNDAGDGDSGANNLQNWPVLGGASSDGAGNINVRGTLNSTGSTVFNLDFYHSASCDAGGNGEGEVYLGSAQDHTLGDGNVSFTFHFSAVVAAGRAVTATATRNSLPLDTSEFSNCVTAGNLIVDTTSDASLADCDPTAGGDCSLRGALTNANGGDSPGDLITFDPLVFPPGSPATITIDGTGNGALPALDGVAGVDRIDGTGAGVILDGAGEPSLFPCLSVQNSVNLIIGLQITDCLVGINLIGDDNTIAENVIFDNGDSSGGAGIGVGNEATGNVIKGNYVGTNKAGSAVHPSGGNRTGININGSGNTVGGLPLDRNVISGNVIGLNISSGGVPGAGNNNIVRRNYIGTDVTGSVDLGNTASGVNLSQAVTGNVIGGVGSQGNIISGNDANGVRLFGNGAVGRPTGNIIQGNLIGTNDGGTVDLGNTLDGILIDGAINTCIGGAIVASVCVPASFTGNLISGNDLSGVEILGSGADGNKLFGNHIGTDFAGTADLGNSQHGVNLEQGAANVVGSAAGPNVISGNDSNGVRISGSNANNVEGNLIGTTASGTGGLGNSNQNIRIDNASNNSIFGNVIAASPDVGVRISDGSSANTVKGNFIGSDASGTIPLGNASHGVHVLGSSNAVGGTGAGEGNTIAFNGGDGVRIDGALATATGNQIRGNSIHHNVGLGIKNINGGNAELARPVVTAAGSASGTATCPGAIAPCTVDVYSDSADEGRVYHGSAQVISGTWSFSGAVLGPNVTATLNDNGGNTSEFSTPFACPDEDADLLCPSGDPCPGDDDCDNDGWMDGSEANFIGTDPLDACPDSATDNAWPADINNDGFSDITDITFLTGAFGDAVPPAPPRFDIGEPADGFVDITDIVRLTGVFGAGCGP